MPVNEKSTGSTLPYDGRIALLLVYGAEPYVGCWSISNMTGPAVCLQVRARQLWGNETYTQDSDLVAVLMHLGYYNHVIAAPPVNALEVCSLDSAMSS